MIVSQVDIGKASNSTNLEIFSITHRHTHLPSYPTFWRHWRGSFEASQNPSLVVERLSHNNICEPKVSRDCLKWYQQLEGLMPLADLSDFEYLIFICWSKIMRTHWIWVHKYNQDTKPQNKKLLSPRHILKRRTRLEKANNQTKQGNQRNDT